MRILDLTNEESDRVLLDLQRVVSEPILSGIEQRLIQLAVNRVNRTSVCDLRPVAKHSKMPYASHLMWCKIFDSIGNFNRVSEKVIITCSSNA